MTAERFSYDLVTLVVVGALRHRGIWAVSTAIILLLILIEDTTSTEVAFRCIKSLQLGTQVLRAIR